MSKLGGRLKGGLLWAGVVLLVLVAGAWWYGRATSASLSSLTVVNANEARDTQVLGVKPRTEQLIVATAGDTSSVDPLNDIARLHWFQYLVAEVFRFPMPVVSAYLANDYNDWPKGRHTVDLHFTGRTWYATIDGFSGRRINVERYTYAARAQDHVSAITNRDSFPNTARFDASDDNPSRVLIGIPCDRAWCQIGVRAPYSGNKADPFDTSTTPIPVPVQRRVRGWYDRKLADDGSHWLYIFPEPGIADYKEDEILGQTKLFATIVESGNTNLEKVYINYEGGDTWTPYPYPVGATKINRIANAAHPQLGAARWLSAFYSRRTNPGSEMRRMALLNLGDMWVRCASGCCEVSLQ